ncbi:MAG: single-stranded DNA-binding protein [Dehalococcoidia bacterium]|nr:single-stranded DNA-binding protein [Dehalococcoidia bacterium]
MKEQDPRPRPWDVAAISQLLEVTPEKTGDIAFGDGLRFQLSDAPEPTSVELFADASVARITTPDTQLTLRRIEPPGVQAGQIVFQRASADERYRLAELSPGGEMSLITGKSERPGSPTDKVANAGASVEQNGREAQLERAVRMLRDALDGCGGDDPSCPDCGPARAFADELLKRPAEQANQPNPEHERLTIRGRIGAALNFRVTANGVPIARFPVAVHRDDGGTTWETVVVFGEKAERLRGALQKGQTVEVVGYAHDREVPKRDGSLKTVHEIYAAVVRTR